MAFSTLRKQFVEVGPDFLLTRQRPSFLPQVIEMSFTRCFREPGYEAGNREGSEKLSAIVDHGHRYCRNLWLPFSERYRITEISDFLRADERFQSKSEEDTARGPFL